MSIPSSPKPRLVLYTGLVTVRDDRAEGDGRFLSPEAIGAVARALAVATTDSQFEEFVCARTAAWGLVVECIEEVMPFSELNAHGEYPGLLPLAHKAMESREVAFESFHEFLAE